MNLSISKGRKKTILYIANNTRKTIIKFGKLSLIQLATGLEITFWKYRNSFRWLVGSKSLLNFSIFENIYSVRNSLLRLFVTNVFIDWHRHGQPETEKDDVGFIFKSGLCFLVSFTYQNNLFLLCRWKAVQMFLGWLRMAICPQRWVDPSLPETHGRQAVQVSPLWPLFLPVRPFGTAHETPCLGRIMRAEWL